MNRFAKVFFVLSAVGTGSVASDLAKALVGSYFRNSQTCRGPGVADDPSKMRCDLTFEDKLVISRARKTGVVDAVEVAFNFHYGYGGNCHFSGIGIWNRRLLWLRSTEKSLPAGCRLALIRNRTTVR